MVKNIGRQLSHQVLEIYRFRAIELRKKGWKLNKIAEAFGINLRSVTRWFKIYKTQGRKSLSSRKAQGPEYKLSKDELKDIISILNDDATIYGFETPLWTCKKIQQMILKKFDKKVHTTNVMRLLKKFNLSPQKPERLAMQRDRVAIRKWKKDEWPKIKEHRRKWQAMLYFQDESGVSLTPVLGRTWAKKGETPKVMVTANRGGFCVTSAISPVGKLIFRIEKEKVNADKHIEFLKQIMKNHPNRKIIVVEDRSPVHRAKKVNNFVEENKNKIAIYYIPPYAPELNPDEHVWKYLKAYQLKTHQAKNTDELRGLVKRKMQSIQRRKELIHSFFI